ncbi:hypothetical protein FOZ61_006998 [Perkinsus olseni]|uniref:Uncharacterized protein n=1 Tax=Perkinsus olseni TaxID=32597 RepID=A0A7J6LB35_PEROL|nr:hypothetical protein FOZ61_006998 [Perkinsus olseni]
MSPISYVYSFFTQAMFKINEDDLRLLIQSVMVAFGISDAAEAAKKIRASPAWVYRHVRRQIPQPAELEERILAVVEAARSVSWEGELLLPPGPDGFDKCLENQLRHIRRGCVSDPDPSVLPLYENLGNVDFQGKPEASLPAYRCYRGSSQLEGIHGWQAKFLAGPNVGSLATQVLVMDGITRHNRRARRKVDSTAIYPLLDNDLLLRLRGSALDNGGVDLYPKLVMNMTDTGERFGLHYTAALRKILLEEDVEDNTQKAPSPADTVAESDDVDLLHDYEVKAIGMSLDHVMEILQAEHGLAEEERLQRHARAESSGSTSKRLAKLSMFGEHSNFLQKTRPERFSLIMCNKIDSLLEKHGQDFDAVYKEYFRWFLAEKAENPEALIFDTSRYHIEQYANAKKREQANAAARVPDIETGARRTRMRSVLSSGSKPYTPAVASQAEQPRPVAQPEFPAEPAPPVPHKDSKQIPVIEGVRCGLCHQVRKGSVAERRMRSETRLCENHGMTIMPLAHIAPQDDFTHSAE